MALTAMSTKASAAGIFLMILKLDQANVPMTTMNITPTNAAIGICSIRGAPKRINDNRPRAATTLKVDLDLGINVDDALTNHRTATHSPEQAVD